MQDYKTSDQKFWTTVRKNHPDYLRWFFADTASALGASLSHLRATTSLEA